MSQVGLSADLETVCPRCQTLACQRLQTYREQAMGMTSSEFSHTVSQLAPVRVVQSSLNPHGHCMGVPPEPDTCPTLWVHIATVWISDPIMDRLQQKTCVVHATVFCPVSKARCLEMLRLDEKPRS